MDPELCRQQASQRRDLEVLRQLGPRSGLVVDEEPLHPNDGIAQGSAFGRSRHVQDGLQQPDGGRTARWLYVCLGLADRLVAIAISGNRVRSQQGQQAPLDRASQEAEELPASGLLFRSIALITTGVADVRTT